MQSTRVFTAAAPLAIAITLTTSTGLAQSADEQKAAKLFREGRAALYAGDHATACPKFAESLALVRRPSTLLNLAICDEKGGEIARAVGHIEEALGLLEAKDPRVALAKEEIERLEPKTARITFKMAVGAPAEARARVDETEITLGAPLRLDPGKHTIVVSAQGREDTHTKLVFAAGEVKEIELTPGAPPPAPIAVRPNAPSSNARGPSRRTIGFFIGGVGAASVAVGAVTGIMTIGKKSEVEDNCIGGCNDASRDAANAGKTLSAVSTTTFIAGGVALGVGTVLVVTGGPQADATTAIAPVWLPGGGGMGVAHRF